MLLDRVVFFVLLYPAVALAGWEITQDTLSCLEEVMTMCVKDKGLVLKDLTCDRS
ncbi:hypothetical protein [Pajaroellobacter abortibovis]|uniref:hypothetical protein n=1 Tax=Pajaroellobacter abortibovis TaxID=1882918 RepID=UPI0012ECB51D|nr:hypothetical protein [Pajaroellobacter abortibovis]